MITIIAEVAFVWILRLLHKTCNQNQLRTIVVSILVLYLTSLFAVTIGIRGFDAESKINLIPFHSLYLLINELVQSTRLWGIKNLPHELVFMVPELRNFLGNILLFIPLGYLVPLLKKDANRWWKAIMLGVGVSLLVEITQFITHRGYFDIDDVILNGLGCWSGWLCYIHLGKRAEQVE